MPHDALDSGVAMKNTDRNTDKIARENRRIKNDDLEVVEKLGCGGGIRALFNPKNTEDFAALKGRRFGGPGGMVFWIWEDDHPACYL